MSYYASSGGLGTDRYPPFSLEAEPDYPARLDIAYPERLSRGLVLVKWWLLAIPHYLIVGLLVGGGSWAWTWARDIDGNSRLNVLSGGLLGLLVLVAGLSLLFAGHYPRALFDLVAGLNRWVYRVVAYAALMTDVYPPFQLDEGGAEVPPGRRPPPPPTLPPPVADVAVRRPADDRVGPPTSGQRRRRLPARGQGRRRGRDSASPRPATATIGPMTAHSVTPDMALPPT